ncbi:poly(A) RNA polymerase GLD2-like [Ptychodera flava]|uniref:poly(A) RNA polymerase GLD2-like n=1 Tax=Ptychodera flava TaxID=63121 RepID=UPI003969C357
MSRDYQGYGNSWQFQSLLFPSPAYDNALKSLQQTVQQQQVQRTPLLARPSQVSPQGPLMSGSAYGNSSQHFNIREFLTRINGSTGSFVSTPNSSSGREDQNWSSDGTRIKRKRLSQYDRDYDDDDNEYDRAKRQKTPVRRQSTIKQKNLANLYTTYAPHTEIRGWEKRKLDKITTESSSRTSRPPTSRSSTSRPSAPQRDSTYVAKRSPPEQSGHSDSGETNSKYSSAIDKFLKLHQPSLNTDKLSQDIWNYYLQNKQTQEDLNLKFQLRNSMFGSILAALGNVMLGLHITGSSLNGFGNRHSDLDMCLMLTDCFNSTSPSRSMVLNCLYDIEAQFRQDHRHFQRMSVIRARVPILRFTDMRSGLDCDININNATGIRNTHLLQVYAKMDWRVAPLVMVIKHWASAHDINDASQSTLSSYSLALMALHYLQRLRPPVIPALQQLYPTIFRNTSDVKNLLSTSLDLALPKNLQFNSENTQSLSGLLKGFFQYFAEEFDFSSQVISVRLGIAYPKKSLNVSEPYHWKHICIEEPFDSNNTARPVYLQSKYEQIVDTFKNTNRKIGKATSLNDIL